MITEPLNDKGQSYDVSAYDRVGYHATAMTACTAIERIGFLPHKILNDSEHDYLLRIAADNSLDTDFYRQWLAMRSVTFPKTIGEAKTHVQNGKAGGQGLINIDRLLTELGKVGASVDSTFVDPIQARLQLIRESEPVIYAVDLPDLGERLVDKPLGNLYQYYWDPNAELPAVSEIDPSRLIAKLTL